MAKSLSESQMTIFQKVIASLTKPCENGKTFLVQGAAGSGKTFLLNYIRSHCDKNDIKAIAFAYTGIASCLLSKGKTVHSQFRIPWNQKNVTSALESTRPAYQTIKNASILLWDQAAFCSKYIFEEVDRFLRAMMDSNQLFGGKVVVMCGDFNECLPIVKHAKSKSSESHSLLFSELYKQMHKFILHENFRFKQQTDYRFCLDVGLGIHEHISIPSQCRVFNLDSLINTTYGLHTTNDLIERSILTVYSVDVDYLNHECMKRLSETSVLFHAKNYFQKIDPEKRSRFYSIDYTIENLPQYFPSDVLELNKNCPIMLKQSYKGLAPGTRLVIKKLTRMSIVAEISAGDRKGKSINIYRINTVKLFPNANLQFVRRQFPVSLCYAMTINKALGLEFKQLGVYFPSDAFAHGQMYVTFSRTPTIEQNMKILVLEPSDFDRMPNIVNANVAEQLPQIQP
ncbi:ATP-dependent DNA helicase PIF1-like [Contarinia nasturtii]|uniref:ATP-dependent DNA helicase PIF1-like n=1 Tax=Contarinia nasturtii TaxID=265458 RepID=UPI0012D441CF|nr:ATP-dependent DNA helicase PIF1-like [Contarinia nasturtii]